MYDTDMARTNIDLDEELVAIIMRRHAVHTKREAVDLALRHLAGTPMTIAEALEMHGAHAIDSIPADQRP